MISRFSSAMVLLTWILCCGPLGRGFALAQRTSRPADSDPLVARADHGAHAKPPAARHATDPKTGPEKSAAQHNHPHQQAGRKTAALQEKKEQDKKKPKVPEPTVTRHTIEIAGAKISYTATAGKMVMKTDQGEEKAHVFFVAYTKDAVKDHARRPISFCFNGGPGSSSVWLHLGMLGPRRVRLSDEARSLPPPHQLMDNHQSLLDITDLVFIDPVSTGYSRAAKGEDRHQFYGYEQDLRSVGQFIHDYTTKYRRWQSPKFLIGESYGGLRAAGLSGTLQQRYHMYLNGIVLVSAVIDFRTLIPSGSNDLAYSMFLPSYAATAWYHKKLVPPLQALPLKQVVRKAEQFVLGPYARALLRGAAFPEAKRKQVAAEMARLTGLSADYVERANLRVSMARYGKELLRARKRIVGRFDSRYLGIDLDHVGGTVGYDPSGAALFGPFSSALNDYMESELNYSEEHVYEILTSKVQPWNYDRFTNRYVNAAETLREAMTVNPYLKVYAACGYYDLATPYFAMKYTRDHLGLDPSLRDHFSMGFYEGGHMMYVRQPSLKRLRANLLNFYQSALATQETSSETGE